MTTAILLLTLLGLLLFGGLLVLLGHAVHADRFMHRAHVRHLPERERERIAA